MKRAFVLLLLLVAIPCLAGPINVRVADPINKGRLEDLIDKVKVVDSTKEVMVEDTIDKVEVEDPTSRVKREEDFDRVMDNSSWETAR